MTTKQAREAVIAAMRRYLRAPQVTVQIEQYRSKSINVQGAVTKEGTFVIPRNRVSLVEALSLAAGLSPEAGRNAIVVRSTSDGGAEQFIVNLEQMLVRSNGPTAMMIEAGDTIHIPEADNVFVIGYVYKPGRYPLSRRMTALELVANAGGPIPRQASASEVFLRRRKADGTFRIMKLDIEDIAAGEASDVVLAAGDTIVVPQTGSLFAATETWEIIKGRIPGVPMGG
jgi:polysaccharide export outer membrane protein